MALGLCACGNKNLEERFVGVWQSPDGTATLTLNADGTASFVETEGANAGEYNFLWVAENNSSIIIKWDGAPIPAPAGSESVEETTEAVIEDTAAVEEGQEGASEQNAPKRKDDPSVVGYGSMTVYGGEMLMGINEGSSTDILLFVYNSSNKKSLVKIS